MPTKRDVVTVEVTPETMAVDAERLRNEIARLRKEYEIVLEASQLTSAITTKRGELARLVDIINEKSRTAVDIVVDAQKKVDDVISKVEKDVKAERELVAEYSQEVRHQAELRHAEIEKERKVLDAAKADLASAEQDLSNRENEISIKESKLAIEREDIYVTKTDLEEKRTKLVEAAKQLDLGENEMIAARDQVTAKIGMVEKIEEELSERQRLLDVKFDDVASQKIAVTNMKRRLDEQAQTIQLQAAALDDRRSGLEAQGITLQKQAAELTRREQHLQAEIQSMGQREARLLQLEGKLAEAERRLEFARNDIRKQYADLAAKGR